MDNIVWHMSHTFYPLVRISLLQVSIAKSHWSRWRPLVSLTLSIGCPHWESSWISWFCLISWRSCRFGTERPTPSHPPADHTHGEDVGVGPTHSPGSWPGMLQVWSACQLSTILTSTVSCSALLWLVHFMQQGARGRPVSPAFISSGTILLVSQARCMGHSP